LTTEWFPRAEGAASFQSQAGARSRGRQTLICFSHLRWDFVFQRPQHLMTRFAKGRKVIFWEEPILTADLIAPTLESRTCSDGGVFGNVSVKVIAYFDLEVFRSDAIEELPDLRIASIYDRYYLEELVKWNWNRRWFYSDFSVLKRFAYFVRWADRSICFLQAESRPRRFLSNACDLSRKSRQCRPSRKQSCRSGEMPVALPDGDRRMHQRHST